MTSTRNTITPKEMKNLRRVIQGKIKADIAILNADILDVYSGKIIKNNSIAIKDKWISCISSDINQAIGAITKIIDAAGKVIIPGFIDSHAHMVYYAKPDESLPYIIPGGTTTIITEVMEYAYTMGYSGLLEFFDVIKDQPIKIFITIPPPITLSKSVFKITPTRAQLIKLLRRDDVVGLGESYWQSINEQDKYIPYLAAEALRLGKTVEGHSAGAHGNKLMNYLTYGISSCHEPINADDVLERLKLGVFVMLREGSIRKDLAAISKIKDEKIDYFNLALVTDGIDPRDLIKTGYMETVVQKAIDLGFNPIKAIQMATINPAKHFRLDSFTGGIAPAKHADLLIVPSINSIKPEYVISKGKIVAHNGNLIEHPHKTSISIKGLDTYFKPVTAESFKINIHQVKPVKIRVIDQVTDLVTREATAIMQPHNDELGIDPSNDILKVSLITWQNKIINCFIRGYKLKSGAVASSNTWENFAVVIIGASENDMAMAFNRLLSIHGGIVVYAHEKVQAELPLPIGGIIADLPVQEIVDKLNTINTKAQELGFPYDDIPKTMSVLTTPAIPFIRLSEDGLVDLKLNSVVDLVVE